MTIEELRAIYDREQRFEVDYPDTRREVTAHTVRYVMTAGRKTGWVLWSDLDADTVEAAITAEIEAFTGLGLDFEWKVYSHDAPPDLRDRLVTRGFVAREPVDAIMVLDLEALPDILRQPIPPSIQHVTTPDGIRAVIAMLNEVWDDDLSPLGEELIHQMAHTPEALSVAAAVEDGRVVSGAWVQYMGGSRFAGLWGGSTLPAYRRRGLYTGLLAFRAVEARRRGVRFLTVDASPMSRPILEKLGFVCIALATACEWKTAAPTGHP